MRLDKDPVRISNAIWVPTIWLLIACSRPVSNWLAFSAPMNASDQYIDGSPLDRNVLTVLLVLAIWVLSGRKRQLKAILSANVPLLLFFGFCGISMLWADYPFVVLKRWIRALADVAMVCVILTEQHPSQALKRVMTWVGGFLIPLSILFVRFFPSLGRSYTYLGVPMWTGVATDKNALGALCMIVGVTLLSRGLSIHAERGWSHRSRHLTIICTLFGMVLYLLTKIDSKTALACFVMASALVCTQRVGPIFRKPWFLTGAVISMLFVTYSVLFLGVGSSTLSEMGRDTTLTGRTQVWDIVLPFAVNRWIGAGYENFWIGDRLAAIVRTLGAGINQAHNGYIEIYLNIGWIGLLLLGLVIVSGYITIMRNLRYEQHDSGLKLAFFLICLVYNYTEAAFKILSPVWITFLWATISIPRAHIQASPAKRRVPLPDFFCGRMPPPDVLTSTAASPASWAAQGRV